MKLTKQNIFPILAAVFILAVVILRLTGFASGTPDFTAVSSTESGHSHIVVISGADIDRPPKERILTTSEDGNTPHAHVILLSESEYRALKAGTEVAIVSVPSTEDNHTHTFAIKLPVSG